MRAACVVGALLVAGLLDRLGEPIIHGSAHAKLSGLVANGLRISVQLRSQVRHTFVGLLPTLGEPVVQDGGFLCGCGARNELDIERFADEIRKSASTIKDFSRNS